jgi:peptide/nickel transport system substrate-binding protein
MVMSLGFGSVPASAVEPTTNKDTYVSMTFGDPDPLDPATNYESFGGGLNQQICERLVNFDGDTTALVGELATSWVISDAGLNYTFTLRQGVTFTDGTPFNAWVMKYSMDRTHIMNDAHGAAILTLEWITSGLDYYSFDNPNVSEAHEFLNNGSIYVIDDYTLRVELATAFAPFPSILNYQSMCAVSPKFVIERAPAAYAENVSDDDFGMVDLDVWFPELNENYTKLGLAAAHPKLNSGVIPGSSTNAPAEHFGFVTDIVGTGPYKLAENITSTQIRMVKNTDWWNAANFHADAVDEYIVKMVDEGTTRYLELEAGNADSASLDQPQLVQVLKNVQGVVTKPYEVYRPDLYSVHPVDRFSNRAYFFNMNDELPTTALVEASDSNYSTGLKNYLTLDKFGADNSADDGAKPNNPFTSVLFREAWALSMDYEEVIDVIYAGLGFRMEGVIPRGMFGYDDQMVEDGILPDFSPVAAEALFEQVGWTGTVYIAYNSGNTFRKTISQLLKNTVEAYDVGISVIVQEFTWPTFLDQRDSGNLAMYLVGWGADYADPHNFVTPYFHSTKGYYGIGNNYTNPEVDAMIDAAALMVVDSPARQQAYSNIERNASADMPMIYLTQIQTALITRSWISDLVGSGALNPVYSARNIYSIGKPDTWAGPTPEDTSSADTSTSVADTSTSDTGAGTPGFEIVSLLAGFAVISIVVARKRRN